MDPRTRYGRKREKSLEGNERPSRPKTRKVSQQNTFAERGASGLQRSARSPSTSKQTKPRGNSLAPKNRAKSVQSAKNNAQVAKGGNYPLNSIADQMAIGDTDAQPETSGQNLSMDLDHVNVNVNESEDEFNDDENNSQELNYNQQSNSDF